MMKFKLHLVIPGLLFTSIGLRAQDTPAKWRLNINAQDAYLVNTNLRFGAERIFPHTISWSLGFDRLLFHKSNLDLRAELNLTLQNTNRYSKRFWPLFSSPLLKGENQFLISAPILLSYTKGRKLNPFLLLEPSKPLTLIGSTLSTLCRVLTTNSIEIPDCLLAMASRLRTSLVALAAALIGIPKSD